jgi:hypothetical protein
MCLYKIFYFFLGNANNFTLLCSVKIFFVTLTHLYNEKRSTLNACIAFIMLAAFSSTTTWAQTYTFAQPWEPNDFACNTGNFNFLGTNGINAIEQLKNLYPTPRYKPGHTLKPSVVAIPLIEFNGAGYGQMPIGNKVDIYIELARKWNYYIPI